MSSDVALELGVHISDQYKLRHMPSPPRLDFHVCTMEAMTVFTLGFVLALGRVSGRGERGDLEELIMSLGSVCE